MFSIPERLKAALEARLQSTPVNARHLIVAAGIDFEEILLPNRASAILSHEQGAFRLSISNTLGERAQNIAYAKALAHLLLHADRFGPGSAWVDGGDGHLPIAYSPANIGPEEEATAINMAIEILVPTVALRQAFLYHQGSLPNMAKAFGLPAAVVQKACIRRGLLDPRSVAAA